MPHPWGVANPIQSPPALHDRAIQDLSFIRRTMEGAASFTDVPGWGLLAVGVTAIAAAPIAAAQPTPERWLAVWVADAVLGALVGGVTMLRKMRSHGGAEGGPMLSIPARKFLLGFWPAVLAGAVITLAIVDPFITGINAQAVARLLPGLWLLLYGVGVLTAGAFSVRAVPLMGLCFVVLGTATLFIPRPIGDLMMALGFGVVQVVFGIIIARRHGG